MVFKKIKIKESADIGGLLLLIKGCTSKDPARMDIALQCLLLVGVPAEYAEGAVEHAMHTWRYYLLSSRMHLKCSQRANLEVAISLVGPAKKYLSRRDREIQNKYFRSLHYQFHPLQQVRDKLLQRMARTAKRSTPLKRR